MPNKTALITGITGQDGAYLASLLLNSGYRVYGTYRKKNPNLWRLDTLGIADNSNLILMRHELSNFIDNHNLILQTNPNEVYNLAAISTLAEAENEPYLTSLINGLAPVSLLDAIIKVNCNIRFFQASSAEIFGVNRISEQTEKTELRPQNSYALSKAYAHKMVEYYRQKHGLFACNGILYNHESPLRGSEFVTRKISSGLADIAENRSSYIEVGNLEARRDWGHAKDYVEAMALMLSADTPDTYILSTGKLESVRTFVSLTCEAMGVHISWEGSGIDEVGIKTNTGDVIVKVNSKYFRPEPEVNATGNPGRAHQKLGWKAKVDLRELCKSMVIADLAQS